MTICTSWNKFSHKKNLSEKQEVDSTELESLGLLKIALRSWARANSRFKKKRMKYTFKGYQFRFGQTSVLIQY